MISALIQIQLCASEVEQTCVTELLFDIIIEIHHRRLLIIPGTRKLQ
jgi:hypothetical protein